MNKQCAHLLMEDLPKLVCHMRQNFCDSEFSGLTPQQHRVMSTLLQQGTQSTTQLAKELAVSLPAISRMSQTLAEYGWIEKSVNKTDKRQTEVSLTKKGEKAIKHSRDHFATILSPRIQQLSDQEKKTLIKACEIMNQLVLQKEKT